MALDNNFWERLENKTKVNKSTIMSLAEKLSKGGMKDKNTLNEAIDTLSSLTGKTVSDEKREKIIGKIVNDKVPNNIDKMF